MAADPWVNIALSPERMNQQLNNAFTLFLSLLVEAMPFLLLGFCSPVCCCCLSMSAN